MPDKGFSVLLVAGHDTGYISLSDIMTSNENPHKANPSLSWMVATQGYAWFEGLSDQKEKGTFLIAAEDTEAITNANVRGRRTETQPYDAGADSALFWKFAEIDQSKDGICSFANKYGLLGPPLEENVVLWMSADGKSSSQTKGVRVERWTQAIARIRWAAQLWHAARSADLQTLNGLVRWTPKRIEFPLPKELSVHPYWSFSIAEAEKRHGAKLSKDDLDILANQMAGDLVGQALSEMTETKFRVDPVSRRPVRYQEPAGLIGILWSQLASAMERHTDFRRCAHCGEYFEIAPGIGRADRQYCSKYHRLAAVRVRRSKALDLHRKGEAPDAIARSIGADLGAVKRWIAKR